MPTPFPGMDPYLEQANLWSDVHNSLIADLRNELAPQLLPKYYIALEERTYLDEPGGMSLVGRLDISVVEPAAPTNSGRVAKQKQTNGMGLPAPVVVELPQSAEVKETYLEVRLAQDDDVVTVIEILSPANKRAGEGRRQYEHKRQRVLDTFTHLVEIDLLRGGAAMPMRGDDIESDYRILISRAEQRPNATLYPFNIRIPIPDFYLPLQANDEEPLVQLNRLLHILYDRVGYQLRINYRTEVTPRLSGDDAEWAHDLLEKVGLR